MEQGVPVVSAYFEAIAEVIKVCFRFLILDRARH
jgi:hypothetical protein